MSNHGNTWPLGLKSAAGAVAAVISLGSVYFGLGVGTEGPKKEASARVNPAQQQKPVHAMNVALGDMVYLAQDLGFAAINSRGSATEVNKIAARIEGQLQEMREIYRQQAAKNPSVVGAMILQLDVAASGEVLHATEVSSRLANAEFKRTILAEAATWSFSGIAGETLRITCPLLFVHEGMDITTLVRWERPLGNFPETAGAPRLASNNLSATPLKSSESNAPSVNNTSVEKAKNPEGKEFRIKYATSLRQDPNFSAPSLTTFTIGTRVAVLRKQGDWLEVRARPEGPTGFIRKEFVAPVDIARK